MLNKNLYIFIFFVSLSCSPDNHNSGKVKDSRTKLGSDQEILQLGIEYNENPTSESIAFAYFDRLILAGCYTQAVYLMDEFMQQYTPDDKFWLFYFKAAIGGHHFEKLKKIPAEEQFKNKALFDAADSILKYNAIIQKNAANDRAYMLRGEAYLSLKDLNAAEYDFTEANKINPSNFLNFYNLLFIKIVAEKYNEAIETISLNDRLTLKFAKDEQDIIKTMMQTIEMLKIIADNTSLSPKEKYFEKAKVFSKVNNKEIALIEVNKAIDLDPGYSDAFALRAYLYYSIGKLELALQDIEYAESISRKANKSPLHQMIKEKIDSKK